MAGPLILKNNPVEDLEAATKQYVDSHTSDIVLYTPQSLTNEQKTQARENIAAASINEVDAIPKPNLFINPLLQIWQQYPSGWPGVPVNRYVCDGWRVLSSDGNKQNNLHPASPYGMTSAAGGANCTLTQFLENAAQFNGLQMTCSVLKIDASGIQSFVTSTKRLPAGQIPQTFLPFLVLPVDGGGLVLRKPLSEQSWRQEPGRHLHTKTQTEATRSMKFQIREQSYSGVKDVGLKLRKIQGIAQYK